MSASVRHHGKSYPLIFPVIQIGGRVNIYTYQSRTAMFAFMFAIPIINTVVIKDSTTMCVDMYSVCIFPYCTGMKCLVRLLLFLIYTHIVYLIAHRQECFVYLPTITSHSQIKQNIMRRFEGIDVVSLASVHCGRKRNFVQQLIIKIQTDEFLIPVHTPNVEFIRPFRIFTDKF